MQYSITSQKSQGCTFSVISNDEEPVISESGVLSPVGVVNKVVKTQQSEGDDTASCLSEFARVGASALLSHVLGMVRPYLLFFNVVEKTVRFLKLPSISTHWQSAKEADAFGKKCQTQDIALHLKKKEKLFQKQCAPHTS